MSDFYDRASKQSIGMPQTILLLLAIAAVVSMVVLIARFKVNPFIAIFGSSLALALTAGMPAGVIASDA